MKQKLQVFCWVNEYISRRTEKICHQQWQTQNFPNRGGEGGGANPKEARKPIMWPILPEKCMEMRKIGPRVEKGDLPTLPLNPPVMKQN